MRKVDSTTLRFDRQRPFFSTPGARFYLGLLLVGFALRIFRLDGQSIWWDEGISLHLATSTLSDLLADRLNNIHPPLYFILLKGWVAVTGQSAFAGRYLSLLAAWLQIPLFFWTARQFHLSQRGVWLGSALVMISPLSIIYGQEIRVYAFLPLIFLLLLGFGRRIILSPTLKWSQAIPFALTCWLGLHLHYIVVIVVAYTSIWVLLTLVRRGKWIGAKRFFAVQSAIALFSLPWFYFVWRNYSAVMSEANAGTYLTAPVSLEFVLRQVWLFHLTGLAGIMTQPGVWALAATVLVVALLLFFLQTQEQQNKETLYLWLHWLVPLSGALFLWSVRSFSHPRYISLFAVPLFLIIGSQLENGSPSGRNLLLIWTRNGFQVILLALFLFLSSIALSLYFFDKGTAKDDIRGVASFLAQRAVAEDLILVPDTDWSLPFTYDAAGLMLMPQMSSAEELWPMLAENSYPGRRLFQLDYEDGTRDWQNALPVILETAGNLQAEQQIDRMIIREYLLDTSIAPPKFTPLSINYSGLRLAGAAVGTYKPANGAIPLIMQWEVTAAGMPRLWSAIHLDDPTGYRRLEHNQILLDEQGRPSELWEPGQHVTTYHLLALPPGTPPVEHHIALQLFSNAAGVNAPYPAIDRNGNPQIQKQIVAVTQVTFTTKRDSPYAVSNPIPELAEPFGFTPAFQLIGGTLDREEIAPGESLFVYLQWHSNAQLPALEPTLLLRQNDRILTAVQSPPLSGAYPTNVWQAGEIVVERWALPIPPTASGFAELYIEVNGVSFLLDNIEIIGQPHIFTPAEPQFALQAQFSNLALLTGYDLAGNEYSTSEKIPITLHWQALETGSPTGYHVFVHLKDENGRLLGQHDGVPANGQYPTTGWLAEEYIADMHEIELQITLYTGPAQIWVGMYDPDTGNRLTLDDGRDQLQLPAMIFLTGK